MTLSFQRLGRSKQPVLRTIADLRGLLELDDALWVSTAAPVQSLNMDPVFLARVDGDGDGRIRSDELRKAIRSYLASVSDPSGLPQASSSMDESIIDPDGPHGAELLDAMARIRADLDHTGPLSLDQVRALRTAEEAKGLSSAGRVLPAAAGDDAALAEFLEHVLQATGGEPHPSGDAAVTADTLDRFVAEGRAWLEWHDTGAVPEVGSSEIQILGADTAAAAATLDAVSAKLDQFFLLCDAIALDPDLAASTKVDASEADLLEPSEAIAVLQKAPVARPVADGRLDLSGALNPAWRARLLALLEQVVQPLLGPETTTLTREDVNALTSKLAPFTTWKRAEPANPTGEHGVDALREHMHTERFEHQTRELLEQSTVAAVALDGVKHVEGLMLYQAHLLQLANNMAALPDLFDPSSRAAMERGMLVFDGRELDLAVPVFDRARAERFAKMSPMFILFVLVGEKGTALREEYMVPVTAGEREHLVDGMWGIHFDVDGNERHAFIRAMAANPISIKEALLAPFRRAGDALQRALDKAADSQSASMNSSVSQHADTAASSTSNATETLRASGEQARATQTAPPTPATSPPDDGRSGSGSGLMGSLPLLLAGAGIAFAALAGAAAMILALLGRAASYLAGFVIDLPIVATAPEAVQTTVSVVALPLAIVLVILGVLAVPLLMYCIPITIATWFRLRSRDLATLLEGTGWAINTRLYLDRPLANQLTRTPKAP